MKNNLLILGSTGSIGTQTLDVVDRYPDRFNIEGLVTLDDLAILADQIGRYTPRVVVIVDAPAHKRFVNEFKYPKNLAVLQGAAGTIELLKSADYDIVVNSIVGSAGLVPSLKVLKRGKRLCLANKEALVIGGELINESLKKGNGKLIPIDSEHSALLQASLSGDRDEIRNLILTASGGPFWDLDIDFSTVTPKQALAHPNWEMGKKISIDSATMMNKGLEVIEAHYLFNMPPDSIKVVVHPESIVHSIVEFKDSSQIAQLSRPDMRLAIQYALTYPARLSSDFGRLTLSALETLHFYEPDLQKFPCLKLSYEALKAGHSHLVVLNSANEAAVRLFLEGKVRFDQIPAIIETSLEDHDGVSPLSIEALLELKNRTYKEIIDSFVK